MSGLTCRGLVELDYLDAITDLLLRVRSEDLHAGLWEAADLQWWWRDEGWDQPDGQVFWMDEAGVAIAALLLFDDGRVVDADCCWLPSARRRVETEVWPQVHERLSAATRRCGRPATLMVRDDDRDWQRSLALHGFEPGEPVLVQTEQSLSRAPEPIPLAEGFTVSDAVEWDGAAPHHLARRNGARVMERLRQCSLYRPELDLSVRHGDDVAAYCLAWLDEANGVGLFEPVRTEDAFQGRGLGTALLSEGLRRLFDRGARIVRVSHAGRNEAASRLYERVGFQPTFRRLTWRLPAPAP